ncbi:MAG TPA: TadE/TadG family type IV pilus assembly protein [Gammaproteobacteria bacterium]
MRRTVAMKRCLSSIPKRQRGIVMILFALGLVVLLGVTGVALDGAHGMLNKTRLQNLVDAAALSGAKTLDQTDDPILAEANARAIFNANAGDSGNAEIQDSLGGGELTVAVQFSTTLHPFVPGTSPERYVRVIARNLRLDGWFIPVMGFDEKVVGASAVAGPSPTINTACNIAPMMVCGDPNAPANENFGYPLGFTDVLKASTNSFDIGPGNFQLIRLGSAMGGADIREAMAGGYDECASVGDVIPTEPGNTVGPVVQGFNTRFGIYSGPMNGTQSEYPPDVVTREPTPLLTYECPAAGGMGSDAVCYEGQPIDETTDFYDHGEYASDVASNSYNNAPIEDGGPGAFNRRTMAVPVGDCTNTTNGQGDVPLLGFLCYHMVQRAEQHGNRSQIYGQFIDDGCPVNGRPGPLPGMGPGPYIIQLYKDEDAPAS